MRDAIARWYERSGFQTLEEAGTAVGIHKSTLSLLLSGAKTSVSRTTAELFHRNAGIPLEVFGFASLPQPAPPTRRRRARA